MPANPVQGPGSAAWCQNELRRLLNLAPKPCTGRESCCVGGTAYFWLFCRSCFGWRPRYLGSLIFFCAVCCCCCDARVRARLQTLIALGAKHLLLIQEGQVWRLLTPILLHGGVLHMLMNVSVPPLVESCFGSVVCKSRQSRGVVLWCVAPSITMRRVVGGRT